MYVPLPYPEEMAAWDKAAASDAGVKPEILMENASREAARTLLEQYGPVAGRRVLCFAGPGNNGGDAFAIGRHLREAGASVLAVHTKPLDAYKAEAGYHVRLARRTGLKTVHVDRAGLNHMARPDIIVDGLLGTGIRGQVQPQFQEWINLINHWRDYGAYVLAVDAPSGLDCATGAPRPVAVRAHATATFEAAKHGLVMPGAAAHTGRLSVRPIGIPRMVKDAHPPRTGLLTPRVVDFLPPPAPDMHKGGAGKVCIVGGSRGLTGAPHLAGLAALRAGAGLVFALCPAGVGLELKNGLAELIVSPLGGNDYWTEDLASMVLENTQDAGALVVGPGLGREAETDRFLAAFMQGLDQAKENRPPLVLDADGLHHLANEPSLLQFVGPTDVITPHPGEAARLLGASITDVQADRPMAVQELARQAGCTAVLKGAATLVAPPPDVESVNWAGPSVLVSPFCEPALSVGGSGDVLAGVLGALLARGLQVLPAACLSVYWHGFSGQVLARRFPQRGALAGEIAGTLPHAMEELRHADS